MLYFLFMTLTMVRSDLIPQELEIGLITFDSINPGSVFNQLVVFETPFHKPPHVIIALTEHTYSNAFFAKIQNITQDDFIIQFFSINAMTAKYRYLATIDDRIQMNCTNFKVRDQFLINFPTPFSLSPKGQAFLTGIQQQGQGSVAITIKKTQLNGLLLNIDSKNITTIGVCIIAGTQDVVQLNVEKQPKFIGSSSLDGIQQASISMIAKMALDCQDEDCLASYYNNTNNSSLEQLVFPYEQLLIQPIQEAKDSLAELKNYFVKDILKEEQQTIKIIPKIQQIATEELQEEFNQIRKPIMNYMEQSNINIIDQSEIDNTTDNFNIENKNDNHDNHDDLYDNDDNDDEDENEDEDEDEIFIGTPIRSLSIDFQFQLSKLKDALKSPQIKPQVEEQSNRQLVSQVQQAKPIINKFQTKKQQIETPNKQDSITIQKEILSEQQGKLFKQDDQEKILQTKLDNNIVVYESDDIIKQQQQGNTNDIQLQQKESHLKSIQKALLQIQIESTTTIEEEVEVEQIPTSNDETEINETNPEQEPTTISQIQIQESYQSPLFIESKGIRVEESAQVEKEYADYEIGKTKKRGNLRKPQIVNHKFEGYVELFEKDSKKRIEEQRILQSKKEEAEFEKIYHTEDEEDSLSRFEREFEMKKQAKLDEIKKSLKLKEFTPQAIEKQTQKSITTSEDTQFAEYKNFFFS